MNKLFNKETKEGKRNIITLTVVLYWVVFWILPSVFLNIVGDIFRFLGSIFNFFLRIDIEGFIYYYLIIAPLLSILPYKILKDKLHILKKYNFKFFIFTILVPYIYVLLFFFYVISQIELGGSWI